MAVENGSTGSERNVEATRKSITYGRIRSSIAYRVTSRSFRLFEGGKHVLHSISGSRPKATLFIFGCQRSGTTHLERLFRADPRSVVFGEFSALSVDPGKTVWVPLSELRRRLDNAAGDYAVVRSLLASHMAAEALNIIPGSRAVWMFRRAEEVVASMQRKWAGNFETISRSVESDASGHWELEALWRDLHGEVAEMSVAEPGSEGFVRDLYALYWYARNVSYFDRDLKSDRRIRLLDYRTLLENPAESVRTLTNMIGLRPASLTFPLQTGRVHARACQPDFFSPEVRTRCDALYARLCAAESAGQP